MEHLSKSEQLELSQRSNVAALLLAFITEVSGFNKHINELADVVGSDLVPEELRETCQLIQSEGLDEIFPHSLVSWFLLLAVLFFILLFLVLALTLGLFSTLLGEVLLNIWVVELT